MFTTWMLGLAAAVLLQSPPQVVVYTALDRSFSEPILQDFEQQTGIRVLAVYDTESTKTVGLVNRIMAEKDRPRCDLFWNNEIVNTIRLKNAGLLQPFYPVQADAYPGHYRDPDGQWYGFSGRARVLLVHNDLVPMGGEPQSILGLADERWKGKIGIAKPLFGTTATHVACLFSSLGQEKASSLLEDWKRNDIRILAGNKHCAQMVSSGQLAAALTDTDDAVIEIEAGKNVRIVYLDDQPGGIGTLFIPNTLSVIRNCPNHVGAEKLADYLLSAEVERRLADGPSAQIPLRADFKGTLRVQTPAQVQPMLVDFSQAAGHFETATRYVERNFLK